MFGIAVLVLVVVALIMMAASKASGMHHQPRSLLLVRVYGVFRFFAFPIAFAFGFTTLNVLGTGFGITTSIGGALFIALTSIGIGEGARWVVRVLRIGWPALLLLWCSPLISGFAKGALTDQVLSSYRWWGSGAFLAMFILDLTVVSAQLKRSHLKDTDKVPIMRMGSLAVDERLSRNTRQAAVILFLSGCVLLAMAVLPGFKPESGYLHIVVLKALPLFAAAYGFWKMRRWGVYVVLTFPHSLGHWQVEVLGCRW